MGIHVSVENQQSKILTIRMKSHWETHPHPSGGTPTCVWCQQGRQLRPGKG